MADVRLLTSQLEGGRGADDWTRRTIERDVSSDDIKQNYMTFLGVLQDIFLQQANPNHDFLLEEVNVAAEIDGDGKFRLMGSTEGTGGGAIRFTFRRQRTEQTADVQEVHLNTPHEPLNVVGPGGNAIPLAGPGQGTIPVLLSGQVNPAPGPLTVILG